MVTDIAILSMAVAAAVAGMVVVDRACKSIKKIDDDEVVLRVREFVAAAPKQHLPESR